MLHEQGMYRAQRQTGQMTAPLNRIVRAPLWMSARIISVAEMAETHRLITDQTILAG